jgi:DNA-binding cell septation regulator SpoVG
MEINVEWQEGQYPSFNLILSSKVGVDPFITIKGCGIMQGSKGEFVKYPSKKLDSGKWFNYIYANDKFNSAVLEKAHAAKKDTKVKTVQDIESDIPF